MIDRKLFKEAFKAGYKAGMKRLNEKEDDYDWRADEYPTHNPEDEVSVYLVPVCFDVETDADNPLLERPEKEWCAYIFKNCILDDFEIGGGCWAIQGDDDSYYDVELDEAQKLGGNRILLKLITWYAVYCPEYEMDKKQLIAIVDEEEANEIFRTKGFKDLEKNGFKLLSVKMYLEDADYLGEEYP